MKPLLIQDSFYPKAQQLRDHFDLQFADPKNSSARRFVWDYWHVPDQYTLLRTPSYHYFPEKIYSEFHSHLVQWGRENLGCHDISPPWLSCYVDGCMQELHSDVPHGPWAFVFSLTPLKQKKFTGGETLLLRPEVLSYWSNFVDNNDREKSSFVERVPAKFNRLVVFDPRIPHGVTEVCGTQDPREGRLVMHGWFVEPRPYVVGALSTREVQSRIEESLQRLQEGINHFGDFHGTLSFRIRASAKGEVSNFRWLTNTLVSLNGEPANTKDFLKFIANTFAQIKFAKKNQFSDITVPLLFK